MRYFLFSYGTLQQSNVQSELFGRVLKGTKDSLSGFKLVAITIHDPAFLSTGAAISQQIAVRTNDPLDFINGTALEVTYEELIIADRYEPKEYKRSEVVLISGKKAWVYMDEKRKSTD